MLSLSLSLSLSRRLDEQETGMLSQGVHKVELRAPSSFEKLSCVFGASFGSELHVALNRLLRTESTGELQSYCQHQPSQQAEAFAVHMCELVAQMSQE